MMELLIISLGWAMALGTSGGLSIEIRRGPHHPKEAPLPPGVHPKHYRPSNTLDKLTQDTELIRDMTHIQEDLGRSLDGMSDEELEFYYFKLHDFDKNSLLDGLEMLKAIYHMMDHEHDESDGQSTNPTEKEMDRYIDLVDKVLEEDDLNKDGFLSYPEFALGRSSGKSIDIIPKQSNVVK